MNYYLNCKIYVTVELSEAQFDLLFTAFENSTEYNRETMVGGFIYGFQNMRKHSENKSINLSLRQLEDCIRVLENR